MIFVYASTGAGGVNLERWCVFLQITIRYVELFIFKPLKTIYILMQKFITIVCLHTLYILLSQSGTHQRQKIEGAVKEWSHKPVLYREKRSLAT
jgi:hypothetical protein